MSDFNFLVSDPKRERANQDRLINVRRGQKITGPIIEAFPDFKILPLFRALVFHLNVLVGRELSRKVRIGFEACFLRNQIAEIMAPE